MAQSSIDSGNNVKSNFPENDDKNRADRDKKVGGLSDGGGRPLLQMV